MPGNGSPSRTKGATKEKQPDSPESLGRKEADMFSPSLREYVIIQVAWAGVIAGILIHFEPQIHSICQGIKGSI